ncbi:MAG: glutamate synthase [Hyphomicrobiales bacterium]|nr:MAG: glutamate synthase [Hyphomicrobiales bacterium]
MSDPVIAQKAPYPVEVEEGKAYFWCACGRSKNQPFCDGSHAGTDFQPVRWKADASGRKFFCGCKMSKNQPFCDGTHSKL